MTGHSEANATSTEIAAAILGMRDNYVHGIINTQQLHEKILPYNMNIILEKDLKNNNMLPLQQSRVLKVSQ
jgi:3-oxoacyl-(acyl-carrier-protein) synthase